MIIGKSIEKVRYNYNKSLIEMYMDDGELIEIEFSAPAHATLNVHVPDSGYNYGEIESHVGLILEKIEMEKVDPDEESDQRIRVTLFFSYMVNKILTVEIEAKCPCDYDGSFLVESEIRRNGVLATFLH